MKKDLDTGKTPNHDSRGKFKPGNKAATGDKRLREMRTAVRSQLVECAYSLLRPYETLAGELKDKKISRYQHILNKAIVEGNIKLITWVTEMAVGRPKFDNSDEKDENIYIAATKEQQEALVRMAMQAREAKDKEEKNK